MQDLLQPIQKSLQQFVGKIDLRQATTNFWNTLGYASSKINYADTWADIKAQTPSPTQAEQEAMPFVKEACIAFQIKEEDMSAKVSMFNVNTFDKNEPQSYVFLACRLQDREYKRETLATLTRLINKPFLMPFIVLFTYADKVSIGVINRRLNKTDDSKDVLEKVTLLKDIDTQQPKRAQLEILQDLALPTLSEKYAPKNFLDLHNAWQKTLDTKELNKRFFKEIANWYFWASGQVRFPQINAPEPKDDKIHQQESVLRLLTRLLFCWFLKEKDLIKQDIFLAEKLKKILKDFEPNSDKKGDYYQAILQNLFFTTLNVEMNERVYLDSDKEYHGKHDDYGNHAVYRYIDCYQKESIIKEIFSETPFLNGGLFECLDITPTKENGLKHEIRIDGFSSTKKKQAFVSNELFFSPKKDIDLSTEFTKNKAMKKASVRGLMLILDSYKFTVEENTSLSQDVALDPELLGLIFENLLAYFNPETATASRNATGSFYTPKEIVDYIVEEALIAFLLQSFEKDTAFYLPIGSNQPKMFSINEGKKGQQGFEIAHETKDKDLKTMFRDLLNDRIPKSPFTEKQNRQILDKIYKDLKILDPACGSGAFPMGTLEKLVNVVRKLDAHNKTFEAIVKAPYQAQKQQLIAEIEQDRKIAQTLKNQEAKQKAIQELDRQIQEIEDNFYTANALKTNDYARKLYLIQNCLYGVDIQQIAIQITKLRFFIALVIEQQKDTALPNLGIETLPNLETKIIAANTLIQPEKVEKKQFEIFASEAEPKEAERKELRAKFFVESKKEKKKTLVKDEEAIAQMLYAIFKANIEEQNATLQKTIDFQQDVYTQNYDLWQKAKRANNAINNTDLKGKKQEKAYLESATKAKIELEDAQFKINQNNRNLQNYERTVKWTPYSQTQTSGWFDYKAMFGLQDGFDIIVGNPPYIQIQTLKNQQKELETQNFLTYTRMGDLYALFYERGNELLRKNGVLCFITSNKWLRAGYGESLRRYLIENTEPLQLLDMGAGVFESATVDTNILMFRKLASQNPQQNPQGFKNLVGLRAATYTKTELDLPAFFEKNAVMLQNLTADSWNIADDKTQSIKAQIEKVGKPLKEWDIEVYRGILTGFNEAFIIDEATKNDLIRQDAKSAEIIKPILRGRDVRKYKIDYFNLYIIHTHNGIKEKGIQPINTEKDFPSIYNFLRKYEVELKQRVDKGSHWSNLRNCAYFEEFEREKIVYPETMRLAKGSIGDFPRFYYDELGFYCDKTVFTLLGNNLKYLTALLNSNMMRYMIPFYVSAWDDSGFMLQKKYLEQIPIPQISLEAQKPFEMLVEYVLWLRAGDREGLKVNEYVNNLHIAGQFEEVLDAMVFELYFEESVKAQDADVLRHIVPSQGFVPILPTMTEEEKRITIGAVYDAYRQKEHIVRNKVILQKWVEEIQTIYKSFQKN